jgi:uncharacterized membrane protein YidH (DUF202 family)
MSVESSSWSGRIIGKLSIEVCHKGIAPSFLETSFHISSYIGIDLVLIGGFMEIFALKRFTRNQDRIKKGSHEPTALIETIIAR